VLLSLLVLGFVWVLSGAQLKLVMLINRFLYLVGWVGVALIGASELVHLGIGLDLQRDSV